MKQHDHNNKETRRQEKDASVDIMDFKPVSNRVMVSEMMKKLIYRDKGLIGMFLVYTIFTAVYPLFAVYLPGFLIRQIEVITSLGGIESGHITEALQPAMTIALAILLAYFIGAGIFGFVSQLLSGKSYSRLSYLRMDYLRDTLHKMMTMDYRYYEDARFMDKSNRINRAHQSNDTGVELVYRNLFMTPASILSIVLVLAVLGSASLWLMLLPILTFATMLFALNRADLYAFSLRDERSGTSRRLFRYNQLTQDFAYGKDIRLFSLEHSIFAAYRQMADAFVDVVQRVTRNRSRFLLLPLISQILTMVVVLMLLVRQALLGTITIASFTVYLTAYVSVTTLLDQLAQTLIRTASEARYVKDMIAFHQLDLNSNCGVYSPQPTHNLTIEFEDVSFSYPGTDKLVLEHLNLKIAAGEKFALVGINGAGKSTLVKLMTGLHHPTHGRILINGVDTREWEADALFDCFSVVFQKDEPISYTVAEHVAATLHDIDREKVEAALKRAGLWSKIETCEDGMDQMLLKVIDPDGLMLSGGETQKLMLARSIYKDAPAVVLDEPTSALDALAETKVYQDFANVMKGKTALFISHRLASTSFCDKIVLLSGGVIAESGTHDELMANRSAYYDMYVTQGKYYQSDEDANVSVEIECEKEDAHV